MVDSVKILVVDDEEHTRLGYGEILKLAGYEVEMADNGLDGLEMAKDNEYALIISDLRMPKMDGLEFIEKLHAFDPDVRMIVITAFGSFKSYSQTMKLGVLEYLNKPVRAKELKEAVAKLI